MVAPWRSRPSDDTSDHLPPSGGGLSPRRRLIGLFAALVGLPALTGFLVTVRDQVSLDSVLLIYLLAVVGIAVIGGLLTSLVAAVESFLLANWFLTPPYYTFDVEGQDRVIELIVFLLVASLVSVTVDLGARNRVRAERHRMEAGLLSRLTAGSSGAVPVEGVLEQVQKLFGMESVALVQQGPHATRVLAAVGPPGTGEPTLRLPAGDDADLVAFGPEPFAEDRRLLGTLATAAARAWDEQRLTAQAAHARELAETDRVRSALLAAVSHDLRTPLAGIKASASSLRQTDVAWTVQEQDELLDAIEKSTNRLDHVISSLLDMTRIQAGALSVHATPVAVDEVVAAALLSLGHGDEHVDVPEDLPAVLADGALLERVLVNLLANARRFSPPDRPPVITATQVDDAVNLTVLDHGPGVAQEQWAEMFEPFQTLGDRDPRTGLGMGLAIALGLCEAMHVDLAPRHTPGGGLTMRLTLPVAP